VFCPKVILYVNLVLQLVANRDFIGFKPYVLPLNSTFAAMKVCVDIGNTNIKTALFSDNEILEKHTFENIDRALQWVQGAGATMGMLSTVRDLNEVHLNQIRELPQFWILDSQTPVPFENLYQSPQTLGSDRLAAVAGALALFGEPNLMVVDAGTCLTIDILRERQYLGGAISPGISMRIKAMHQYTSRLPLVEIPQHLPQIGSDTRSSLQCGALWGILFELDGWRKRLGGKVVFTGGDAQILMQWLEAQLHKPNEQEKFHWEPNLVLIGLNAILEHVTKN
jgi:type III pantothenate kinase